jgi:hypothetical protein
LRDSTGQYSTLPFFTNFVNEVTGEPSTCFVKHWDGDEFYVIRPPSTEMPTHVVERPDGTEELVRMMVLVGNECVDLFDFQDEQGELRLTRAERLFYCFLTSILLASKLQAFIINISAAVLSSFTNQKMAGSSSLQSSQPDHCGR